MHEPSPFASRSLAIHLARGALGIGAVALIFVLPFAAWPWLAVPTAVGLAGLTVYAWRGCPSCWTIGLIETIARTTRRSGGGA